MFFASCRPYFLRQLLIAGTAYLLIWPWGPVHAAIEPISNTSSSLVVQQFDAAQNAQDRDRTQWWLWLLLGIAPIGAALPWLYRWHRASRPLDRSVAQSAQSGNQSGNQSRKQSGNQPIAQPVEQVTAAVRSPAQNSALPLEALASDSPENALEDSASDVLSAPSPDLSQADSSATPPLKQQSEQSQTLNQPTAIPLPAEPPESRTTRLTKIDIVETLATDLHSPDSAKRSKAIWELGQRGDSRAIQPLVDLLVDADSQQRSLILAALAEISTRSLKPMQRALMISLQDESPDVRKNAIRDITRIYDLMAQASQILQYAANDDDEEVQDTARWALGQLGRVRSAELGSHNSNAPLPPEQ